MPDTADKLTADLDFIVDSYLPIVYVRSLGISDRPTRRRSSTVVIMIHVNEKVDSAGKYSPIKNRPEQPSAGAIREQAM
jgi:hypothetical protein